MTKGYKEYVDLLKRVQQHDKELYQKAKAEILADYRELGDWDKVLPKSVYIDSPPHFTAFIDLVAELSGEPVNNGRDLQRLTGITVKEPATDGWQSWESLEQLVTLAKENRYITALTGIIIEGGTYKDMAELEPSQFGLPDEWKGFLEKEGANKETCIRWAIILGTNINEPARELLHGNTLRDLATMLEAPYGVILDAYHRVND